MTLRSVVQPLRIDSIEFYVTAKGKPKGWSWSVLLLVLVATWSLPKSSAETYLVETLVETYLVEAITG